MFSVDSLCSIFELESGVKSVLDWWESNKLNKLEAVAGSIICFVSIANTEVSSSPKYFIVRLQNNHTEF